MITLRWQWDIKRQISFICPDHVMSLWSLRGSAFAWRTALSNRTSSSLLAHTTPKEPTAQAPWCGTRNPCCHSLKQRGLGNQLEMDVSLSFSFSALFLPFTLSLSLIPPPLSLSRSPYICLSYSIYFALFPPSSPSIFLFYYISLSCSLPLYITPRSLPPLSMPGTWREIDPLRLEMDPCACHCSRAWYETSLSGDGAGTWLLLLPDGCNGGWRGWKEVVSKRCTLHVHLQRRLASSLNMGVGAM